MGTPLPPARLYGLWVETAANTWTKLNTDTGFAFALTRDVTKTDYRGAAFKRSTVGTLDASGSFTVVRAETDIAYDKVAAAMISGEIVKIQERNPAGIKTEASVYILDLSPTVGITDYPTVSVAFSIADEFEYHAVEVQVGA